jgi:hypothetical protein
VLPRTDFHGTKLNVRRGATRTGLCILLATTCFLVACYSVSSKSDVVGAYELSGASGKLALDLFSDGRFVESIEDSKSSTVQKQTGTWFWSGGRISFDNLWIPDSFAPKEIRFADSHSDQSQPRYTEPGHWVLRPESHWGTVVIEVFDDVSFKKVKHAKSQ